MARLLALFILAAWGELAASSGTNPTHYGDPAGGCESDEQAVRVQGVSGDFCSPPCSGMSCPSDVPSGVTAAPQCALQTTTGSKYCALICTPSVRTNGANGECGSGTCQSIMGVGLCTYAAAGSDIDGVRTELVPQKKSNVSAMPDCSTTSCAKTCECIETNCAAQVTACLSDDTCKTGQACINKCKCGDTACAVACAKADPSPKGLAVLVCAQQKCKLAAKPPPPASVVV